MRRLATCLAVALLTAATAWAQQTVAFTDFARPSLRWHAIETEHFTVLYHTGGEGGGSERSAREVAGIAEEVYGPITSLYEYEPKGKVHIILKDYEDYSNGAAYFYDNKIEIWAPSLDAPLRGDHSWLENVVTHEFTHIVQVQAAMKLPRALPFVYLQLLDYERVKRPDVLYGYPNVIVSYPITGLTNPAWFAEGTAQYQRTHMDHDQWDSHRDMFLRARVLADKSLSLAEMGSFYSKSSMMREGVYNHGYAFTRYLAREYGESILADVTRELSRWRNWNVERALTAATGHPADSVYGAWMQELEVAYGEATSALRAASVEGSAVEDRGHANYYPTFSPDGTRLAYISAGDRHHGRTNLYVQDLESGDLASFDLGPGGEEHICALGHRLRRNVTGAISWHPNGDAIVYSRRRTTPAGYLYQDLYAIDPESGEETRLTHNARASYPAYAADGNRIAYVTQGDGTTNLWVLDVTTGGTQPVTHFGDGTQVTSPTWSGEWIYFALREGTAHGRDLWRIRSDGTGLEAVLATEADERSPSIQGEALYYSSDDSGIHNIYRIAEGDTSQLTQVLGGAFMPDARPDGTVAFARFQWDGYKIALLETPSAVESIPYQQPAMHNKRHVPAPPIAAPAVPDTARRYTAGFTPFNFFPVIRFDQYVTRRTTILDRRLPVRGRGETLLRNTKVGLYVSSREILEGMSLFAGLLVGPASQPVRSLGDALSPSNLLSLERDAFLQFEYKRGFDFLPGRWSPQISVELYNIKRRVEQGLAIEEFPCTACFPDTTYTDLTYALWEGSILARSKVTNNVVVEAGYRYSPYRAVVDQFYSRELLQSIPKTSSRYFIGRAGLLRIHFAALTTHREADVLPIGVTAVFSYERETGRLIDRFDIQSGYLVPIYLQDSFHRLRFDASWGVRLPGSVRGATHGATLRVRGSAILGKSRDDFYDDYVGGLTAARGYPFYALGGSKTFWAQASYTMPIMPDIRRQLLFLYVDKAFLRFYADGAAIWPGGGALRKDIGAELRLKLGSSYLLPTALFASATYGLDAFDYALDEGFVTPSGAKTVRYGKQWQWHFGVLFGFDL